ncbi:endogenous retrovirus group K member 18 Pol protein-like [Alligator mississippiensis]|uniref:ribonuclease H n=1 Tax=Alligator mississippiensis TaxID=8496 RepID=A0A151N0G1_ALLMI|nr:endogenous retrovirus group K member 18 Pol protein-like [Alligator mississippiensis]
MNKVTVTLHLVVPDPYTLLATLFAEDQWFTVLDLKDAFFCIPLGRDSQEIFSFEWEDPNSRRKTQLCWTVLPQDFKNSPTIFSTALSTNLQKWDKGTSGTLLQYVDDLLIAANTREECHLLTVSLLTFLGQVGYRVSRKKAQIEQERVRYLGFDISQGQRMLGPERKEAICRMAVPKTKRQLRGFFGYGRILPDLDPQLWANSQGSL